MNGKHPLTHDLIGRKSRNAINVRHRRPQVTSPFDDSTVASRDMNDDLIAIFRRLLEVFDWFREVGLLPSSHSIAARPTFGLLRDCGVSELVDDEEGEGHCCPL